MKESPTPLRIFLALIGALALLNIGVILQLRGQEPTPTNGRILFTLLFAALSALNGVILFFAAWQASRLIVTAPKFLKFAILFRYALLLVERTPFAISGDYLSISLVLLWSGVSFYMVKTVDRLSAGTKSDA